LAFDGFFDGNNLVGLGHKRLPDINPHPQPFPRKRGKGVFLIIMRCGNE
jgi:hypothetical protein